MAFSNRFHFRYDSIHGVEYNIYILQDVYLGNCDERHLGRAPVLRKQKNGPICGTSLDLFAECVIDGEFAELFTSNPKEYRVDVMRRVNGADVLVWQGFVSTELYSEPSIYPPYDVQIVSTDGLGELKLVDFVPAGPITLSEHFQSALAYTGMNRTIYVASSLVMTGESRTATFDMAINLDYMDGSNYYEVISKLLDTLHATITLYGDKWLILRETDVHSLLSESGLSVVSIAADGTISTTIIGGVHKTVGSMADNSMDTWPVGQLSTAIEPSRKEVTVEAPWHTISGPDDQNMEATIGSPWVTEGIVRHDTTDDCFYELGLDPEHLVSDDTWGTIKQEIPINKLDCGFRLRLRVAPRVYKLRVGDPQWYAHGNIKVHLEYDCYISSGSHGSERTSTYIGTAEGWKGAPQHTSDPKVEIPTTELDSIGERWLSVDIPAISTPESASRYIVSDSATVRIVIEGHWVEVYECILTPSLDLPGYRDIIHLNNDAVGASSPVEITGGRVRSDNLVNSRFYGGIWIYNDAIVTSFADSVHSNGDFLSITALSYALSVAGRRLKTDGKINVPAAFSAVPLFITFDGILSSIETWEWDLFQEELSISAISLPSVEIDVETETVEGLEEDYSGRSSGGSGTGSSASSAYSYKSGGSSFFEEDGNGGIKLKDEYSGLWTNGFLTAGGVGSGSGGGGGLDVDRMWQSLTNSPADPGYENTKIAQAHLPSLNASGGLTASYGGTTLADSLSIGIDSNYKLPTTTDWDNKQDKYLFGITGTSGSTYNLNNFLTSVPKATNSVIGGFKTGYTESGKNYAVKMSGDNAYVNVPWTDTVYSLPLAANGTRGGVQIGYSESDKYYAVKLSSEKMYVYVPWENTWRGIQDNLTSSTATTESLSAKQGYLLANGSARDDTKLPLTGGVLTGTLGLLSENINWNVTRGEGMIRFLYNYDSTTNHAPGQWFSGVSFMTSYTGFQLATFAGTNNDNLYFRQCNDGSTPWSSSWNTIWHSGNFVAGTHYVAPSTLNSYLPLSAGSTKTLTGALFLKGNQYDGYKTGSARTYGIDANNSDIIGVNSILTSDLSDSWAESIGFYRGDTGNVGHYDTFRAANGTFYFGFNGYYDSSNVEHAASENVTIKLDEIKLAYSGSGHDTFIKAENSSGTIGLLTSTNRGLYDVSTSTWVVATNGTNTWLSRGYVGIGTPSPSYKLDVSGVIHSTTGIFSDGYVTAGAAASSSDARLKDNIQSIGFDKAIDLLGKLRGCEWTWNGKKDYLAGKHGSGLIAQEVEPIMPWAVLDLNGEYSLNYNSFWGVAIPVMQSHEERLRQAEKRIADLEAENKQLKARLNN